MVIDTELPSVRAATLPVIVRDVISQFINPVPALDTVRVWLDNANIPRFKANPTAKRGGGTVYYSVSGVEKLMRSRMRGGRV